MIETSCAAFSFVPFSQNGPQPSAHPCVFLLEHILDTVLEVFKPASQCLIHLPGDVLHSVGSYTPGLLPDGFSEFVQALLARPPMAAFEVIAQEIKAPSFAGVDNPRFGRVQGQPRSRDPWA